MARPINKLFQGLTQVTQTLHHNLTQAQGLFNNKPPEEEEDQSFQHLLSHLQQIPKQPTSLQALPSQNIKAATQDKPHSNSAKLKVEEEGLFEDMEEDSGWKISDNDLVLEGEPPVVEEKKDPEPPEPVVEKRITSASKSVDPERRSIELNNKLEPEKESEIVKEKSQESGSRRRLSEKFKDLKDRATGVTKNVAGSFLVKMGKNETPGDKGKSQPGSDTKYKDKGESHDFKNVLDRLTEFEVPATLSFTPPHFTKKTEQDNGKKETHGFSDENTLPFKEQIQRYLNQAHQLEMLVKVEQELLREEYGRKMKELDQLREEANIRLEQCEIKERELRSLDGRIKLKENLNLDEEYLDKIAQEKHVIQEQITVLHEKNQFLELSLKNEQERLQNMMEERIAALRDESRHHLIRQEEHLRNEYETHLKQRTHHYEGEISSERRKNKHMVETMRNWAASFQEYKNITRATLTEIEEMLWVRGEEFANSAQIMKDFQEKLSLLSRNYKAKLEQKDQKITKQQETEKNLREEIAAFQKEKTQALNAKDKEIKELKNQYQKLEKTYNVEKDNLAKTQTKLEEVSAKGKETEEKLKGAEKEKNELRKAVEIEKRNALNLQERIDELSQKGKNVEGTTRTLEKTNNDLKRALEAEKKMVFELQKQLDELASSEKVNDNRFSSLQRANEELEEALEKERSKASALQLQLTNLEKEKDSKLYLVEKANEEMEEALEKEKSKSLSLQLRLDEVQATEGEKSGILTRLEKEKSEIEERYLNEIKAIRAESYNLEETYMKEIDEKNKEIEKLKATAKNAKETSKANQKGAVQELERQVDELTEQVKMMNKEKIHLMEKYKKEKEELGEEYNERFKNQNFYIEEMYQKNRDFMEERNKLAAENAKLTAKFNKMKEMLSVLDTNFKNKSSHSHGNSPKAELRQLLAQFSFFSGASSDATPETPKSRDDLKDDLKEDSGNKREEDKFVTKNLEDIYQQEPKSVASPQVKEEPPVHTHTVHETHIERQVVGSQEKVKKSSPSKRMTIDIPPSSSSSRLERASATDKKDDLIVRKSPTMKDLPPSDQKTQIQRFLEDQEVIQEGGWNNIDVELNAELEDKKQKEKQKRPKSVHERIPSFSEIESPSRIESAMAIMPTGSRTSLSHENTPKNRQQDTGVSPKYEPDSPKFEAPASPRFESREPGSRKSADDMAMRRTSPRFEDYESPTFEGKKLGEYKVQNDSFSNLDEKGGNEGWDVADIEVQDQEREETSPTFEPEFGTKANQIESPTFKFSNDKERSEPHRKDVNDMEEVKMSISPKMKTRSPSFSNYGEEDREPPMVQRHSQGGKKKDSYNFKDKEDKYEDNKLNMKGGIIELESPKFRVSNQEMDEPRFGGADEIDEPRFGGSTGNLVISQKGPGVDLLNEDFIVEPRFGGSTEEVIEQKGEWGIDDILDTVPEDLGAKPQGGESDEKNVGSTEVNKEIIQEEAVKEKEPEKKEVDMDLDVDVNVEGEGWGFDVNVEAPENVEEPIIPHSKQEEKPKMEEKIEPKKGEVAIEEPLIVEGGWDTNLDDFEKGLEEDPFSTNKPSEPVKETTKDVKGVDDMMISPELGGGWDVDLDTNLMADQPVEQSKPEPKRSTEQEDQSLHSNKEQRTTAAKSMTSSSSENTLLRSSMGNLSTGKENQQSINLGPKPDSPPYKSVGKIGTQTTFDETVVKKIEKNKTEVPKGEEKKEVAKPPEKKGGLVINKIFLPGKTVNNKGGPLNKNKEPKDDINLEEFLGSSLK